MTRLASRLRDYASRERMLTALLVAYAVMIPLDPSLPRRSLRLLEPRVYAALVALLVASRGLELSGLPARAASRLLARLRGRPGLLYSSIVLAAGASAALMTNDAALFVYLPLVMSLERILGTPLTGLYVLVALSVNTLSMVSPIGNPQNLYIWQHYRLSAAGFIAGIAPYALAGLGLLVAYTAFLRGPPVQAPSPPPVRLDKPLAAASLTAILGVAVLGSMGMQYEVLLLAVALVAAVRPQALRAVDAPLLAVFALLFIEFGEASRLAASHIPAPTSPLGAMLLAAGLSQAVSNVPATILLAHLVPRRLWVPLAVGANVGGTGLATGSMANLILLRLTHVDARSYHEYALPYFVALLGVSALLLALG